MELKSNYKIVGAKMVGSGNIRNEKSRSEQILIFFSYIKKKFTAIAPEWSKEVFFQMIKMKIILMKLDLLTNLNLSKRF